MTKNISLYLKFFNFCSNKLLSHTKISGMKNILLPIDFSENSLNAARYGAELATYTKDRLVLFHCYQLPVEVMNTFGYISDDEYLRVETLELLEDIANGLVKSHPELSIKWMTDMGDFSTQVKRIVDDMEIDLVIMGTKGASGLKEIFMGSNTSHIIENIDCPVLAVPEDVKFKPLNKMLYATDFNIEDFESINKLCGLSKIFKAEVLVGHISDGRSKERDAELLEWFMELAGPKLCCGNIRFTIHENADFFDGINQIIKEEGIDLISVSTVKKAFFDKVFGISHTRKLSCHLQVPLMAYHIGNEKRSTQTQRK